MKKWKSKKFNIFGDIWNIVFADAVTEDRGPEDPEHWLFGMTDHINKRISVSTKNVAGEPLCDREVLTTIAHECVHAILGSGCYNNSNDDEPMVEFLGKGILSLLQYKVFDYEENN